ncbi:hypothetical protein LCGC14_0898970 [marine sediment metagenome]|uniref:Disease resistance R13L4/SHOC-2-like LRR domain-containing protein n=1 Tax=marine sediment metagenome TaxID=412755 RepID=A0A0F9S3W2_9ZZZZ
MIKNSFKINDYISLILKDGKVNILIEGKEFMLCKGIAIKMPVEDILEIQNFNSVDDLIATYDKKVEGGKEHEEYIDLETEFMVHCSNLQAWSENGYDADLLHYNLAFPLLKKLSEVGDKRAKKVFKEAILHRFVKGNKQVQVFLHANEYLSILTLEEQQVLYEKNIKEIHAIEKLTGNEIHVGSDLMLGDDIEVFDGEITGLRLDGRKEITIPEPISKIKSIKKLILHRFIDSKVPEWIGNLSNLEYLDLRSNEIVEIPKNIRKLKKLQHLNLGDNKLTKFPEELGNLINLQTLFLGHNKLKILPRGILNLKNLRTIGLDYNVFEEFPKELLTLKNIRGISLLYNKIKEIPVEVLQLSELYNFNIYGNPIKTLPYEILLLPKLEHILFPEVELKIPEYIKKKIKSHLRIYPNNLINE